MPAWRTRLHRPSDAGFEAYRDVGRARTRSTTRSVRRASPADVIREVAHLYARADRAMICWTLGITEHHNAVDNVLSLINLALLTGHVGRYGCGLNPLRGQNNVQGGGDMGAIPNRLVGFQDIRDPEVCAQFERAWGVTAQARVRDDDLTQMFERDGTRQDARPLRHRREPGAVGSRPASRDRASSSSTTSSCTTSS